MSGTDHDGVLAGALAPGFAIAPLATAPVSGSALVPGEDERSEHEVVFASVDLTAWAAAALTAIDSLFLLDRAAKIRTADAARATSLETHRKALVEAIVASVRPVTGGAATPEKADAARTAWRAALQLRLAAAWPPSASAVWRLPTTPAIAALDAVAPVEPDSISAAARWSYSVTFAAVPTARDEFRVSVLINDAEPATAAPMPPPNPALFRALARMVSAWPGIEPELTAALNAEPVDTPVAVATLARVDRLIGDLASAWALSPEPEVTEAPRYLGDVVSDAQQSRWDYAFDFDAQPAVTATRRATTGDLPRWPAIEGFRTPAEDGKAEGRYEPVQAAPMRGLTLRWNELPIPVVQVIRIQAEQRHDATPAHAGKIGVTAADPAFILRSPISPVAPPVVPANRVADKPFQGGSGAATLSAAIDAVIAALLMRDALPGYRRPDLAIRVEASRVHSLADDGPEMAIPILLTDTLVSQEPTATPPLVTPQAWRSSLVEALVAWHTSVADQPGGMLRLALSLSLPDSAPRAPLLRIDAIDISVPVESGDWWR